ncbi:MAG: hypothetical protein HQ567_27155 [Candidatus Nealsonbacteria bacterium]|nr:hypothetical protein [Candidatus Nealsonbacteria bacterium]
MKIRDILAVAGVAAVTMAFVLTMLGPGQVGAEDPPAGIKPMIAQPKLTVDGCEFTLSTDKPDYQQGETPTLTLVATNPTDKPVETTVWVNVQSSSPASMFSRAPQLPSPLLNRDCSVKLAPGETKTVTIPTEIKLSALENVSITLSGTEQKLFAGLLRVQQGGQNAQVQAVNVTPNGQAVNLIQLSPEN